MIIEEPLNDPEPERYWVQLTIKRGKGITVGSSWLPMENEKAFQIGVHAYDGTKFVAVEGIFKGAIVNVEGL